MTILTVSLATLACVWLWHRRARRRRRTIEIYGDYFSHKRDWRDD